MTLKNLTWEELERHLEQAQMQQQDAMRLDNDRAYRLAEALEAEIVAERHRRQQERQEPDTETITL